MANSILNSLLLLLSLAATTDAFSLSSFKPTTTALSAATRRSFLSDTTRTIIATSSLILTQSTLPLAASAAAPLTPETALQQWKDSVQTIDNLCTNWDTISKGGGDVIRKELGTANFGATPSPLFQLEKAFKILRDGDDVDLIELTEAAEELSEALAQADSMAYSSNFAGGAGKPTPPSEYIEKSRKEVFEMRRIAKSVSAALNL